MGYHHMIHAMAIATTVAPGTTAPPTVTCPSSLSAAYFNNPTCAGTSTWNSYAVGDGSPNNYQYCEAVDAGGLTSIALPSAARLPRPAPAAFNETLYPLAATNLPEAFTPHESLLNHQHDFQLQAEAAIPAGMYTKVALSCYAAVYSGSDAPSTVNNPFRLTVQTDTTSEDVLGLGGSCLQLPGGSSVTVDCSGAPADGSVASGFDSLFLPFNTSINAGYWASYIDDYFETGPYLALGEYRLDNTCLAEATELFYPMYTDNCNFIHLDNGQTILTYHVSCDSFTADSNYTITTFADDHCGTSVETFKGQGIECTAIPGAGIIIDCTGNSVGARHMLDTAHPVAPKPTSDTPFSFYNDSNYNDPGHCSVIVDGCAADKKICHVKSGRNNITTGGSYTPHYYPLCYSPTELVCYQESFIACPACQPYFANGGCTATPTTYAPQVGVTPPAAGCPAYLTLNATQLVAVPMTAQMKALQCVSSSTGVSSNTGSKPNSGTPGSISSTDSVSSVVGSVGVNNNVSTAIAAKIPALLLPTGVPVEKPSTVSQIVASTNATVLQYTPVVIKMTFAAATPATFNQSAVVNAIARVTGISASRITIAVSYDATTNGHHAKLRLLSTSTGVTATVVVAPSSNPNAPTPASVAVQLATDSQNPNSAMAQDPTLSGASSISASSMQLNSQAAVEETSTSKNSAAQFGTRAALLATVAAGAALSMI